MIGGDDLLAIYLNDHLAGSTVGVQVARRAAAENRGDEFGEFLSELAEEIQADRRELELIMDRLQIGRDRFKSVAAWTAEKLGRLKLNGRVLDYSPLSRLVELEMLSLGVEGKLSLWRALQTVAEDDRRLRGIDLDELVSRARSQRRRLETRRLRAAALAFE